VFLLVLAYPGYPGQKPLNGCVCVCVCVLDLCNGIVKEGCIPEDWKSSVVLPIYKGKDDPTECGSYRGINKVVDRGTTARYGGQLRSI